LTVEEFETRAVPAMLGLSLPTAALHGLHGLLRAVENAAPGLVGRVLPTEPAPVPGGGGVVTPPTVPTLPTTPVVETPDPGPGSSPVGSGGPIAGPEVFTPTAPVTETPTATTPSTDPAPSTATPATTPVATDTGAATATVSIALEGPAAGAVAAFPPTTPVGVAAGATTEAVAGRAAFAAATGVFQSEAPPAVQTFAAAPGPVLMGVPVDPATVAVTPPEAVPPAVEMGTSAPVAVTPPEAVAVAAEAAVPEAVAAPAAEPEAFNLATWGWSAAVAAVAAGGYWAARRYRLVKHLAAYLRRPALTVRA
jgi:hypothetical protein